MSKIINCQISDVHKTIQYNDIAISNNSVIKN